MCFIYKYIILNVRNNFFLIFGLFLGVALSSFISEVLQNQCLFSPGADHVSVHEHSRLIKNDDYEPVINLAGKPLKAQKMPKDFQRPRYYKTELGIRDKLLAAILTSPKTIRDYGTAFNKTTSHLFDKVIFFMESDRNKSKSDVRWNGVVQFSDSRGVLKPFHMLKYIIDNFLDDFDYLFLVRDKTYVRGRELYNMIKKISVSEVVHAGCMKQDSNNNFCLLNSGILLSNLVLHRIASKLDWCIKNAFLDSDDVNVGRCIFYATGIGCSNMVQGLNFKGFMFNATTRDLDFDKLEGIKEFNSALTFWPVNNADMLLKLHAYFAKVDLFNRKSKIAQVKEKIKGQPVVLPDNSTVKLSWPIGTPPPLRPNNRFDILRWDYFTEKKIFLKSDFNNIADLFGADLIDVKYVVNSSVEFIRRKYGSHIYYRKLLNGYRRFDPSRGMDYILDLIFINSESETEIHKRIEICKPLSKVELIPMPYVTENTRVNIVVAVDETNKKDALKFMENYVAVCMEKKDKTFLMLVLLYEAQHPGKGTRDDIFAEIKKAAMKHSERFKREKDNKIAWLSVRLPDENIINPNVFPEDKVIGLNRGILRLVILDLVTKKFPSDSLILYCTSNTEIRQDYLNRVRMNTIRERQVFSPIPFSEYDPDIVYNEDLPRPKEMDINRNYGHYDTLNTEHISFYVRDYREARKTLEGILPIIHTDRDITNLIFFLKKKLDRVRASGKAGGSTLELTERLSLNSVYTMFVGCKNLNVLRAVEPGLRLRHVAVDCQEASSRNDLFRPRLYKQCIESRNFNSGSRGQLGHFILEYMHGCKSA